MPDPIPGSTEGLRLTPGDVRALQQLAEEQRRGPLSPRQQAQLREILLRNPNLMTEFDRAFAFTGPGREQLTYESFFRRQVVRDAMFHAPQSIQDRVRAAAAGGDFATATNLLRNVQIARQLIYFGGGAIVLAAGSAYELAVFMRQAWLREHTVELPGGGVALGNFHPAARPLDSFRNMERFAREQQTEREARDGAVRMRAAALADALRLPPPIVAQPGAIVAEVLIPPQFQLGDRFREYMRTILAGQDQTQIDAYWFNQYFLIAGQRYRLTPATSSNGPQFVPVNPSTQERIELQLAALAASDQVGGSLMATAIPNKFRPKTVNLNAGEHTLYLDTQRIAAFSSSGKAKTAAKKLYAFLNYMVKSSLFVYAGDAPDALNNFIADGSDPANGFNPPITIE